jgi:hypothetical protein
MFGKRLLVLLSLGIVSATMMLVAVPAHAVSPCDLSFLTTSAPAPGSTQVLGITFKVVNDEDSGIFGYWALDAINRVVSVWQQPDGSFFVIATYSGKITTFARAVSPNDLATPETTDASGTFQGGYVATFSATTVVSAFGSIGTKDFGGTQADVLLGTYALQKGPPNPFSYLDTFFPGWDPNSFIESPWGWVYHYRSQSWCDTSSGITGNIVT